MLLRIRNKIRLKRAAGVVVFAHFLALTSYSNTLDKIDYGVAAYMDGGRFFIKKTRGYDEFFTRTGARWNIRGKISDDLYTDIDLHWFWWRNYASSLNLFHIVGIKFDADLEASLNYNLNESSQLKLGLYEFKYNPDSKNLGEYLLRSEGYPLVIENGQGKDAFRSSHARVGGMEANYNSGNFYGRALIYLEQTNIPANDLSLAAFAGFNSGMFDLELGVAERRLLKLGAINQVFDASDSARLNYISSQGLETRSTMFMFRGSFDFFAAAQVESDYKFKLYTEAALLGLKTDTLFYTNLSQRLPIMVGLDLPTWVFDEFAIEVEYLKYPFREKKYTLVNQVGSDKFSVLPPGVNLPNPSAPAPFETFNRDDFKWSVTILKNLNQWVSLRAKIANDHFRLLDWDKQPALDGEPMTTTPGDWQLLLRLEWHN